MKEEQSTRYICDVCNEGYSTKELAQKCESRPISQDKGVQIGDIVLVTSGDGQGQRAKVRSRYIIDMNWGHYAAEKYWHTVALTADLINEWGTRTLTFDSYGTLPLDDTAA